MPELIRQSDLPSIAALAYLGDAVYSHYVRRHLVLSRISKAEELNERALSYVTAEAQSKAFLALFDHFEEDERELAKRASNSGHLNRPRRVRGVDYRRATAFEAIFGMLDYLGRSERIAELVRLAIMVCDTEDNPCEADDERIKI